MMKRDLLTTLGCTGSVALALMAANPANAEMQENSVREYIFTAPDANLTTQYDPTLEFDLDQVDCTCTSDNANILFDDQLGEEAIAQWGCDCAGCRYMAMSRQQMQSESYVSPQK